MTILTEGRSSTVTLLDIRLENDVIILRGEPSEASGAVLKGLVACSLHDSLTVRRIRLELVGIQRVQLEEGSKATKHEEVIFRKLWYFVNSDLLSKKTTVLDAGNYEYPFDVALPGDIPESVEGLPSAYVVYRLKATIERPKWHREISVKKHLRIVRTLSPEMVELSSTMIVESSWPNKCDYSISIPHKACVFGTAIPLDISIIPLLKGLEIGTVTCILKEIRTLSIPDKNRTKTETIDILKIDFNHGGYEDEDGENSGKWFMHANVPLPKSLAQCVQDCEVGPIKIRHKLSVAVTLINPPGCNGHLEAYNSELRAKLPVSVFISPNLLMGEDNEIHDEIPANAGLMLHEATTPPRYNEHIYDRLWEDLPTDFYSTPLPSGVNTPAVISRNNSTENLAMLASDYERISRSIQGSPEINSAQSSRPRSRATSPDGQSSEVTTSGEMALDELRASLAAFRGMGYLSSASASSTETASPDPSHPSVAAAQEVDIAVLSRVPSYRTAIRTGPTSLPPEAPSYDGHTCDGASSAATPPCSHGDCSGPSPTSHRNKGRKKLFHSLIA